MYKAPLVRKMESGPPRVNKNTLKWGRVILAAATLANPIARERYDVCSWILTPRIFTNMLRALLRPMIMLTARMLNPNRHLVVLNSLGVKSSSMKEPTMPRSKDTNAKPRSEIRGTRNWDWNWRMTKKQMVLVMETHAKRRNMKWFPLISVVVYT